MKYLQNNLSLIFLTTLLLIFIYDTLPKSEPKKPKPVTAVEKKPVENLFKLDGKKERFSNLVVPAINKVYKELEAQYEDISNNIDNYHYAKKILNLKKSYKVRTDKELLMALKPHPKSIAIAQAAMESAWGESRFFKEANNLYGVWSFSKKEPRIAASQQRGNQTIWLKQYGSIEESVRDYYITLGRSSAFREFRKLKMKTNDPYKLVEKLDRYSEIGEKYTKDLSTIIRYNRFYLYD
ncbi:glucosaminidase domain-containing protein [Sulfurimonas sp.]|uniref:glucosaminidase domain-containing protein n=1 Tax=Sulfurimonas sp. TaxID=2022749 RepID=UPI0025FB6F03|nr:glucosaminidase domain-containing protein [Sulfurimonas sp.]